MFPRKHSRLLLMGVEVGIGGINLKSSIESTEVEASKFRFKSLVQ